MAACFGRAPEPFMGEPAAFRDWLIEFEDYLGLSVVEITNTLTDDQKLALLKNCVGSASRKIIDGFTLSKVDYSTVTEALKSFYVPKKNITYERYVFSQREQLPDESVSSFLNSLQTLAMNCDFDSVKPDSIVNQRIRDQFILGTSAGDTSVLEKDF